MSTGLTSDGLDNIGVAAPAVGDRPSVVVTTTTTTRGFEASFTSESPSPHLLQVPSPSPSSVKQIPSTLSRYRLADGDATDRNCNCWSEPPAPSAFRVRGPNYSRDGKKISTGPYVFEARGVDLFLRDSDGSSGSGGISSSNATSNSNGRMSGGSRGFKCSIGGTGRSTRWTRSTSARGGVGSGSGSLRESQAGMGAGNAMRSSGNLTARGLALGGRARDVPTFVVNFVFAWGVLANYFEIPEPYLPYLKAYGCGDCDCECKSAREQSNSKRSSACHAHAQALHATLPDTSNLKPHERAVARFLSADDDGKNASLKLIPICAEGSWAIRKIVSGKPAILGRQMPVTYSYHPAEPELGYCECLVADLDVDATNAVGRKAVGLCRKYMSNVTVDIGLVVEGVADDELPECILGCVRLHRLDAAKAPIIPPL